MVAAALLLVGAAHDHFKFNLEMEVAVSPHELYPLLSEPRMVTEWRTDISRIEPLGKELEMVAGSRWQLISVMDASARVYLEKVSVAEPGRRFESVMKSNAVTVVSRVELTPSALGTHVQVSHEVVGSNLFWRSLLYLARRDLKRKTTQDYQRLKRLVENSRSN